MNCPTCKEAGVNHGDIVGKCQSSVFWTSYYLCEWRDMSFELHWSISAWLSKGLDAGKRRFLIMIPRGHFKSSMLSVGLPVQILANDPNARILLVSSTAPLASDKLTQVHEVFRRAPMRHFFDHLIPGKEQKSTATDLEVPRTKILGEPSIRALGASTKVVGGHFDVIIADDLVDGTAEDSELQMRQAIKWLERSNPLFHDRSKGILIVVGTYWPGGFYEKILNSPSFEKLVLGCFVDERYYKFVESVGMETQLEEGTPIFPERETLESLRDARIDMGDYNFSHQMLNLRADDTLRHFRESDILYYNLSADGTAAIIPGFQPRNVTSMTHRMAEFSPHEGGLTVPFRSLYRTLTIDPATGEHSRTDESAIVVCGQDRRNGLMFVLDVWHGRCLIDALIDQVLDMCEVWQPHVIAPEETAFQKTLKVYMREKMRERKLHFTIRPVTPGTKSKVFRIINAFQPFVRKRQVYFGRDQQDLVSEMLSLQIIEGGKRFAGKSPNMVDALAYHVEFWKTPEIVVEEDEVEYEEAFTEPEAPSYGLECYT